MHIDYSITLGNLLTMLGTMVSTVTMIVVWFIKYQRKDDELHATIDQHSRDIEKLTKICKVLVPVIQKSLILAMTKDGDGVLDDTKLRDILEMSI